MPSTIERFFQVLSEIVPNYKEYLNPPCDPSLFVEIENLLGEELPAAFKEFYRIADGETYDALHFAMGWRLLPLSEMISRYSDDNLNSLHSGDDYCFDDHCISYNGNKVKSGICFHRKWFPIANFCDTGYFALDYAPANEGTKGQIMMHDMGGDEPIFYDYASNFEKFIQLITNLLIDNKIKLLEDGVFKIFEADYRQIGKNISILSPDNFQKEKFENLSTEWKEYFKIYFPKSGDVIQEKLTEISKMWWGYYDENSQYQDLSKPLFKDITPLILLPRIQNLGFQHQIDISQLDFVSKYLTQIYKMFIPNVFQQEELKIIGKFKCLFELQLNCGKIDDFSDLLSCKDLARLTINSAENLNLSALSELKELRMLDITRSGNIEDFSAFSAFKGRLNLQMTREQFLKAHTYMNKNNIKPLLVVPYGVVEQPATDEEQIIINAWFDK